MKSKNGFPYAPVYRLAGGCVKEGRTFRTEKLRKRESVLGRHIAFG
jgi:hypothetical protein